jgi:hypothetical protein
LWRNQHRGIKELASRMERCRTQDVRDAGTAIEPVASQTEFLMAVPVCAWCEPRQPGATQVAVTHGICPRHFRQLKLETQKIYCPPTAGSPTPARKPLVRLAQPELTSLVLTH